MSTIRVKGKPYRVGYFNKCELCDLRGVDGECMLPKGYECDFAEWRNVARNYNKQQILDILYSANKDIDQTIMKFVRGCLDKDDKMVNEAKEHSFSIMNPLQQSLSCVIDFIESMEE